MKSRVVALLTVVGLSLGMPSACVVAAEPGVTETAKETPKAPRVRRTLTRASVYDAKHLALRSASALVQDQGSGQVIYEKNASATASIASITKLMTAMVVLDGQPNLNEEIIINDEDVDTLKGTHSRLTVGTRLTREQMLNLALMASENRAAAALSRYYAGGREAFVAAMNQKALVLGLTDTHFYDPTGLTASNVSTAHDLVKMVSAAHEYPLIRQFSTAPMREVTIKGRPQVFRNTNSLVRSPAWDIELSKTGYISEAGKCLVMLASINSKPTVIVLLDSWGKKTRLGDANRIKRMLESAATMAQQRADAS